MKIHLKLRINKWICEGSLQLLKLIKHHNENKALIMQYSIWTQDPCDISAVLHQMSWRANWELAQRIY